MNIIDTEQNFDHDLQVALDHHKSGLLSESEILYRKILSNNKNNLIVLHYLSILLFQKKNFSEAKKYISCAIKISPNEEAFYNLLGNIEEAENNLTEALKIYEMIKASHPHSFQNKVSLGNVLYKLKRFNDSIGIYENLLLESPNDINIIFKLANCYNFTEEYEKSILWYSKFISLEQKIPEVFNNRGYIYKKIKDFEKALSDFSKAIELKPDYADTFNNIGNLYRENKNYNLAILNLKKAIEINPYFSEAHNNLGNVHFELEKHEQAILHYDNAIKFNSKHLDAYANKAYTLVKLERYDEAFNFFHTALKLNINKELLFSNYVHTKLKICDWLDLPNLLSFNQSQIKQNKTTNLPFPELSFYDLPEIHKICSEKFCEQNYYTQTNNSKLFSNLKQKDKIYIGYISSDFCDHPVSNLLIDMLELHDKEKFKIIGINIGNNPKDEIYKRLSNAFDEIIDVNHLQEKQIAEYCRELEIDIAIDLNGHTENNRMGIFTYRAAPIQLNFLGYPGTSGNKYIDYIIADKTVIPEELKRHYTEKVIYLPNSYLVTPSEKIVSKRKFCRADFHLPEDQFVFCCFNNSYKINPKIFKSWMNILKKVNKSVLWLSPMSKKARNYLRQYAIDQGIDKDRLIFSKNMKLNSEHLRRFSLANLFLDTFPYNAHSTAIDSIWAGVPIVTLTGKSFTSRVVASILNTLNLKNLISYDFVSYEKKAIELATNPNKLRILKTKLKKDKIKKTLFNTKLYTHNIEIIFKSLFENYLQNKDI